MEEWKEYRLGEIANIQTGPFGSQLHNKDYVENGTPIVTVEHLGNKKLTTQNLPCVTSEDRERLKKYSMEEGDVIFSRVGSVDRCSYVDSSEEGWLFSGRCLRVRPTNIIFPLFLYYYLCQPTIKRHIRNIAVGATMPSINTRLLSEVPIEIPALQMQERIASILSSLDDKIELNRKINSNLEEQAKALFKSWFIDFEPFKDGKFVDSELGKIPEGWEVVTIGDVTENIKDKVGDRDNIKVLSPITSGQLVLSEDYFSKQVFSNSIAKYIVVKHNDFAYNPARINIGSIGMNEFNFDGCVSPVYVVFRCQKGYEYFFNLYRRTTFFAEEVKKRAIGGVRQTLSYKDLSLIQLVYPPQKVVDNFNSIIISLLHTIHSNDVSNKKLEAIRDLLLPRLMSGEINVRL